MGFDVYGINPIIHKEKKQFKTLYKFDMLGETEEGKENWAFKWNMLEKAHQRTKNAYWKQHGEFEAVNPGVYFRNNVWWWRPLWDFVCNNVEGMTQEDWESGHMNDGHKIEEDKAKRIADYLDYALRSGIVKDEEDRIKMENEKAKMPYPFSEENVREFSIFCHDSGGFTIC